MIERQHISSARARTRTAWGWWCPRAACSPVEVGGPEGGVSAVGGEVAYGVAELLIGGPAEGDGTDFAGLAGGGGDPGEAGQRIGGGEAAAGVADLGEQSGGAYAAGAEQAGEDRGAGRVARRSGRRGPRFGRRWCAARTRTRR